MVAPLRIYLFGRLQIQRADGTAVGLESAKVQELLCYLLLRRGHPQSRDALAALLWPDTSAERARKYLRQALWHLRAALDMDAVAGEPACLVAAPDASIAIQPHDGLWLDLLEFEDTFGRVQRVPGPELSRAQATALEEAIRLYQGDLLEGWYQDWCLAERERLQAIYLTMLDKLMAYHEARQDFEAGLHCGGQIQQVDPVREGTHRRMMRLHHLAGDRASALRQYQRCAAVLQAELGVRPSRRTAALAEQIRADQIDPPTDHPAGGATAALHPSGTPLADVLSLLKQLRTVLGVVQREVQQDIQMIEQTLNGGR